MTPLFSLVMCTLGGRPKLDRFLASLAGSTCQDYELIVVVQGDPATIDAVTRKVTTWPGLSEVVVLTSPRGASRARNVGYAAARGRYALFPDDDCWYPNDVLARVAAEFEADPSLMLLTGRVVDAQGVSSNGTYASRRELIRKYAVFRQGIEACMAVRRTGAYAQIRFDEALGVGSGTPFGSGEGTDFILQGLDLGGVCLFDPDLTVGHDQLEVDASPGYAEKRRSYARGYGFVLRRRRFSPVFVALNFAKTACGGLVYGARGDLVTARAKFEWLASALGAYLAAGRGPDKPPHLTAAGVPPT